MFLREGGTTFVKIMLLLVFNFLMENHLIRIITQRNSSVGFDFTQIYVGSKLDTRLFVTQVQYLPCLPETGNFLFKNNLSILDM